MSFVFVHFGSILQYRKNSSYYTLQEPCLAKYEFIKTQGPGKPSPQITNIKNRMYYEQQYSWLVKNYVSNSSSLKHVKVVRLSL